MYKWSRTAMVAPGKGTKAIEFAVEVADYVEQQTGLAIQTGAELAGEWGRIHWFADPENAAQWESVNVQLAMDETYKKMIDESGDLFIGGMTKDTLVMLYPRG